jgi:hypothetical protein
MLEQATAWRILTHALGVDLRHRLIPLITAGIFPLDTASEILTTSGLPPLPRLWHTDLDAVSQRAEIAGARAARDREGAAYRGQAALIRTALLTALDQGDIDSRSGVHAPFATVDDLLRNLGLTGLPRAHLHEVTAAIPLLVSASSAPEARIAAYRLLREVSATTPQYGMPITVAETFREPDITADRAGSYRVTWYETYLVCLRGIPAERLAEAVVRIQLGVLAADVPGIRDAPLHTTYLGEHVDHRLDPGRD